MEEHSERIEDPREALKPHGGRDELNLAEFPISLLSDRVPKGCKTLVFEIEPSSRHAGTGTTRKLTITGGDAYGLPTAIDDELLVGLVQLTKLKNGFTSPVVSFSRYELVKILGWPDNGNSYSRIEESIKRWAGVTLYYDNAWWNKEAKAWVSETFHIIERSSLVGAETRRAHQANNQQELPLSSFRWNEVIFQSFQAGALKRLDIDAYFSFKTSVAKRMYRFLDKRFWIKTDWEFDLKEFAFERIGLSRGYNVGQIKSKLQPAIDELTQGTKERAAFLEEMTSEERYLKVGKGQWIIKLARKAESSLPAEAPSIETKGLLAELVARDVSAEVAAELVKSRDAEFISLRIEVFDWILQQKNQKLIKQNPTGFLISSIRDRYLKVPKEFESKADRQKRVAAEEAKRLSEMEQARLRERARVREERLSVKIDERWKAMSDEEQSRFEGEALAAAPEAARRQYQETPLPMSRRLLMTLIRRTHLEKLVGATGGEAPLSPEDLA
jgi:hypothetical protein